MVSARKLSIYAVVVGLVCLPAPVYIAYGIAYTTPDTTEAPFHGPAVDPAEGSPATIDIRRPYTEAGVNVFETGTALTLAEEPENTSAVLDRAIADGTATATRPQVRADLRALADRVTFLFADGDYYTFSVTENGSRLTTEQATDAQVVRASVPVDVVDYETLSPDAQDAVDAIIANTSTDGYGDYQPHTSNPVVDREPFLVARGDTVYAIYRDGGTYMGQEFLALVYGPPITLVGLVLLVAGLVGLFLTRGE